MDREILDQIAGNCPGFQARATARAVTRLYNACFRPLGLTAEQFSLLVGIGASEGITIVELARQAGVDSTTLSRNIQALERQDRVLAVGGRGRSGKHLQLTPSGRHLLEAAVPLWRQAMEHLTHQMGEEKLLAIRKAMVDLAGAADKEPL